ncbi:hypothetical protein [Sedimenticola selenatireducens]|nr:hypothetical protein [Sedimenticola selenatireducens]
MGEEADYLESQCDGGAERDMRELEQRAYYDGLNKKEARYRDNKRSEIGTTIRCANCGGRILKKSYQTQFCSNSGKGNCKDTYWNNVSDRRRDRSHRFSH